MVSLSHSLSGDVSEAGAAAEVAASHKEAKYADIASQLPFRLWAFLTPLFASF